MWQIMAGLDGRFSFSNRYDAGELYRLGGARSLRGYDEDQFRGASARRVRVELRARFDADGYAFLFHDLGFVEPVSPTGGRLGRDLYPGYGAGIVFPSALGPIALSYAVNPDEGLQRGRIHVGLAFGL